MRKTEAKKKTKKANRVMDKKEALDPIIVPFLYQPYELMRVSGLISWRKMSKILGVAPAQIVTELSYQDEQFLDAWDKFGQPIGESANSPYVNFCIDRLLYLGIQRDVVRAVCGGSSAAVSIRCRRLHKTIDEFMLTHAEESLRSEDYVQKYAKVRTEANRETELVNPIVKAKGLMYKRNTNTEAKRDYLLERISDRNQRVFVRLKTDG